jgi:hypothetical protein
MRVDRFVSAAGLRQLARLSVFAATLYGCIPAVAQAEEPPAWPDSFVSRLEALALIQSLNAEILGSSSATLTLEKWCRDYRLAEEPKIVAHLIRGVDKPPTAEQRQRLQVTGRELVKYRRVQLRCGGHVLSEAENWYVPSRMTSEMNRLLEITDTPFGKVIQPLGPYRQTLSIKTLWSPLPDGWARESPQRSTADTTSPLAIPDALFEHRAILYIRKHKPLAEVYEVYQRQILAFSRPRPH